MSKIKYEFTKSENGILMISQIKTFEDSPIQEIDNYPIEHSVKLLNNQQSQISDLEAKLAEKDAELEKWSTQYARAYVNRQNDLIAEKEQLKQQLAEKGQEVETLKAKLETAEYWNKKYDDCQQQLTEKEKELEEINREFVQSTHDWKEIVKDKIKAKTEFAIQQLQRVRNYVIENSLIDGYKNAYGGYTELNPAVEKDDILKELDAIIKKLEGK